MIEAGDTYLGLATDHVIESFRDRLWAGYKTGAGIEPALLAQGYGRGLIMELVPMAEFTIVTRSSSS
jgi:hypothetical protein